MGMTVLCDGCGVDVQTMDRISISFASIEVGSIQADLCMACSEGMRSTPVWQKILTDTAAATEAENLRRQSIIAEQAAEFEARSAVMLEQQKEANAAMRAAGEV